MRGDKAGHGDQHVAARTAEHGFQILGLGTLPTVTGGKNRTGELGGVHAGILHPLADGGTASVLRRYGIESNIVDKISTRVDTDPEAPVEVHHAAGSVGKNVVQLIEEGKIDMILNTPNSRGSRSDGYSIRAAAIAADLPQFTTITEFQAALLAIEAVKHNDYQIMSIQEHSKQLFELERREF